MDIETAAGPPIRQASEDDLRGILASDLGERLALVRNYGDFLEATALPGGSFRVRYYDAVSGRAHAAAEPWSSDQVKDAFLDYFQGNWNWHGRSAWRTITNV